MRLYPDCDDEPPEECPAFMEDACPVMLKEQDKPCDGCRWLFKNPNYEDDLMFDQLSRLPVNTPDPKNVR